MASVLGKISLFLKQTWDSYGDTSSGTWKMLLPSEVIRLSGEESRQLMDRNQEIWGSRLEKCKISDSPDFTAFLFYPKGWDRADKSKCVVFNNPSTVTVAQQFAEEGLTWTAARVAEVAECPILLYDYAGTGLNYDLSTGDKPTSLKTSVTYQSIVVDGVGALSYAFDLGFEEVINWGSALGGAVAACATEKYLEKHPDKWDNVIVVNHDSFSATPLVFLSRLGWTADRAGSSVGGNLDAATPIKTLVGRGVKVLILCHKDDCVIPEGGRMEELFQERTEKNAMVYCSPHYAHAELTDDMIPAVKQRLVSFVHS